ncbi:MAG: hypothetical protein ABIJ48_08330 [Actinomycetota bacterium]
MAVVLLVGRAGAAGSDPHESRLPPIALLDIRISGPSATSDEPRPAAAWKHATNRYLVVWHDHRKMPIRGIDICGWRVTFHDTPAGGGTRVGGPQATGRCRLVSEDARNKPAVGSHVHGRHLGTDGKSARRTLA